MTGSGPSGDIVYRADVDGLRAVAVISVILYHSGVPFVSGGFVGVDVFFVISGFLIASIIFRELDAGRFTFRRFYERRFRRIAPALTAVLLATTMAAAVLLSPRDLWRYCASLLATLAFSSNIYFWQTSGYFTTAAESRPLLHTWSLAIEEQFYLLFPLLAVAVARRWPSRRVLIFGILLLTSAAACVLLTPVKPAPAFYLLPTRAWELGLGVVLAATGTWVITHWLLRNLVAVAGLGAILASVVWFDRQTTFPGVAAMLPTLGTWVLIGSGGVGRSAVTRFLTWKPTVVVGKMSYSLYLWHWPVLVFFRALTGTEPHGLNLILILALVFALSALSYRLVEQPMRRTKGRVIPLSVAFKGWATTCVLLALFAAGGVATVGYAPLQRPEVNLLMAGETDRNPDQTRCFWPKPARVTSVEFCPLGPITTAPRFLVWGDSHADMLMPVFKALAGAQRVSGLLAASPGCIPVLGDRRLYQADRCPAFTDTVLAVIQKKHIRNVILVAYWTAYAGGWESIDQPPPPTIDSLSPPPRGSAERRRLFAAAVPRTLHALDSRGARVWVIGQVPSQPRDVPSWAAQTVRFGGNVDSVGTPLAEHRRREQVLTTLFQALREAHVDLIDPADILCSNNWCGVAADGHSLYSDFNHLSTFGAMRLLPRLRTVFQSFR